MKKSLMVVALAATTAIAAAQDSVTFTKVLDTATTGPGAGSVYAGTYVPVGDKFLASRGGTAIEVYNASTGAFETNLSLNGISPSGLGFFALTATEAGVIYGFEDGGKDIWRWASVTDPDADMVYDTVPGLQRVAYTGTNGSEVTIASTGNSDYRDVHFFSDTFPFSTTSFAFNETVDLHGKSSLAINNDGTIAFTVGDIGANAIHKWVKTDGVWGATPAWTIGTEGDSSGEGTGIGGGPMAYDNTHDILFIAPAPKTTLKLYALSGADGSTIGEIDLENALATTTGYCGGWVVPTATGGTVYLVGRAASPTQTVMYVYDYEVESASVNDWSLYEQ